MKMVRQAKTQNKYRTQREFNIVYQETYLSVEKRRKLYHLVIAALVALLLVSVAAVAFECVGTYANVSQSTDTWSHSPILKAILQMEQPLNTILEGSFKRLDGGIKETEGQQPELKNIPLSGFWSFSGEERHTFTFSSTDAQVKNGYHQSGIE